MIVKIWIVYICLIRMSLEEKFLDVAKIWHPTKNGKKLPKHVKPYAKKKCWFMCSEGHEFEMFLTTIIKMNEPCYECRNIKKKPKKVEHNKRLDIKFPEIAKEWHPTKNGDLKPSNVSYGSELKIWWKCTNGHEWKSRILHRIHNRNCPHCKYNTYSKASIRWLEAIIEEEGIHIQHAGNIGEKRINLTGQKYIMVDGFCEETNTIYSYHGCLYHSCEAINCPYGKHWKTDDFHPFRKNKTHGEIFQATLERDQLIKKLGYNQVVIWECEHKKGIVREFT